MEFDVVLADPPWRYDNAKPWQKIENHYPTMSHEEIKALPVSRIAAKDCVLFLWTTAPKLEEGVEVLNSWGFRYKTCMVWRKEGALGMGYYARIDHELVLIGVKGSPKPPPPDRRVSSVIDARKGRHSVKPRVFHETIEAMYPNARRVELFSRNPRPGWAAWGNQSEGVIGDTPPLEGLEMERGEVLPLEVLQ